MPLAHKSAEVAADSPLVGQRIDRLVQQLCGLTRSQVTGLFDHGCVSRNGLTAEIDRKLNDQFAASKPEREYVAIVAGQIQPNQGTFESLLATDKDLNRFSTEDEAIGQLAITHFRVVARLEDTTLVQVRLE